jgi:two-component system sensor histidine kinase KdpD
VAAAAIAACTLLGALLSRSFDRTNVAMVYLLAVVLVALRYGRGPSILAALASVLAFDFIFVTPYYSFAVSDTQYLLTFGVMLTVATVIGTLTVRMQRQTMASRQREHRTAALYEIGRELVGSTDSDDALAAGVRHVQEVFDSRAFVLLPDAAGSLRPWTGRAAGAGTRTLPGAGALYLPLAAGGRTLGVMGVRSSEPGRLRDPERLHLLETFAGQIAVALERDRLAEERARIGQIEEMERLKGEFVAVASRELRAPLARLAGTLNRIRDVVAQASPGAAASIDAVTREAERLRVLARDLLDLSRLESGRMRIRLLELDLASLVRASVGEVQAEAERRGVGIKVENADDLPPVRGDRVQIRRVLTGLLLNALRYSPRGGEVLVAADDVGDFVQLSVADTGAGIPVGDQARIFDKFVQVRRGGAAGGTGLGLAIAREVLHAHGGEIWVDSGPGPATVFSFTLPLAQGSQRA